jgi:hypothetical protein
MQRPCEGHRSDSRQWFVQLLTRRAIQIPRETTEKR